MYREYIASKMMHVEGTQIWTEPRAPPLRMVSKITMDEVGVSHSMLLSHLGTFLWVIKNIGSPV